MTALAYLELGWPVFPLVRRGKVPILPRAHPAGHPCRGECGRDGHGHYDATCDAATIRRWWGRWPAANSGLATGRAFDVLDVDGDTGRRSLYELVAVHGLLPEGPSTATGGGGYHLLFAPTGLGNRAGIRPGLDWRGIGGYIVAPPSVHPSGRRYAWIEPAAGPAWVPVDADPLADVEVLDWPGDDLGELPPAPPWLVDLVAGPRAPALAVQERPGGLGRTITTTGDRRTAYGATALNAEADKVARGPVGRRNDMLNAGAYNLGQLVGAGILDAAEVVPALLIAALRTGLAEAEAEATIVSGMAAGQRSPRRWMA